MPNRSASLRGGHTTGQSTKVGSGWKVAPLSGSSFTGPMAALCPHALARNTDLQASHPISQLFQTCPWQFRQTTSYEVLLGDFSVDVCKRNLYFQSAFQQYPGTGTLRHEFGSASAGCSCHEKGVRNLFPPFPIDREFRGSDRLSYAGFSSVSSVVRRKVSSTDRMWMSCCGKAISIPASRNASSTAMLSSSRTDIHGVHTGEGPQIEVKGACTKSHEHNTRGRVV